MSKKECGCIHYYVAKDYGMGDVVERNEWVYCDFHKKVRSMIASEPIANVCEHIVKEGLDVMIIEKFLSDKNAVERASQLVEFRKQRMREEKEEMERKKRKLEEEITGLSSQLEQTQKMIEMKEKEIKKL